MKTLTATQIGKRSKAQIVAIATNAKKAYDEATQQAAIEVLQKRVETAGTAAVPTQLAYKVEEKYAPEAELEQFCFTAFTKGGVATIVADDEERLEAIVATFRAPAGKKAPATKAEPKAEPKATKKSKKNAPKKEEKAEATTITTSMDDIAKAVTGKALPTPATKKTKKANKKAAAATEEAEDAKKGANLGKKYKKSGERIMKMTTADDKKVKQGDTVKFAVKGEVVSGEFRHVNKNVHSPNGYAVIKLNGKIYERVLERVFSTSADDQAIIEAASVSNLPA